MKCPLSLSVFLRIRPPGGLNISGHVLVEMVEKLRGQRLRTGCGPGPTLVMIKQKFR